MSCENSTRVYCTQMGKQIAPALGITPEAARDLLLQVHELTITRVEQAPQENLATHEALKRRATDQAALEATVEVFRGMQSTIPGLPVPAHGDVDPAYGLVLPKRATQHGWLSIRDVCRAVDTGVQHQQSPASLRQNLSPLAQTILTAQAAPARPIEAVEALHMANQQGDAVYIEAEGQIVPVHGGSFAELLTAIKGLPGRSYNPDNDGRGKRWIVPGKLADIQQTLQQSGLTVDVPGRANEEPHAQQSPHDEQSAPTVDGSSATCPDCGAPFGKSRHRCQPSWLTDCNREEMTLAKQAIEGVPNIIDLANHTRRLGFGSQGGQQRQQLQQVAEALVKIHTATTGGVVSSGPLLSLAQEFQQSPYRSVGSFARTLAIAAGVNKCAQCGRFIGSHGHDCPAQLVQMSKSAKASSLIHTLATHEAVQHARSWRAYHVRQSTWDAEQARFDDFDEADDFDEPDDFDEDATNGFDDDAQYHVQPDTATQERSINNLLAVAQTVCDTPQQGIKLPGALILAAEAFAVRPTIDQGRQFIHMLDAFDHQQRPAIDHLPTAATIAAWRAFQNAPHLTELANGTTKFRDDRLFRMALDAAAAQFERCGSNDQALRDALIDYREQPHRYAVDLASALCEAAQITQCDLCGQFLGATPHLCTASAGTGKLYDQNGYDQKGFNRRGFNRAGYNKNGRDERGYDNQGLDADGFNRAGYNQQGAPKHGYAASGYDGYGFDQAGFDQYGYDKQGLDADGFDENGYDSHGHDRLGYDEHGVAADGRIHSFFIKDAQGFYRDGLDDEGFDRHGFAPDGNDRWGYDRDGYNRSGFNRYGFNSKGVNANSIDAGGWKNGLDATGFDRVGYDDRGFDHQGWSWTSYDKAGKDRNGQARTITQSPKTGKPLPARYNKSGWDQFGYDGFGYHRTTGLTAPDAQGQQWNYCGWRYDPQTKRCVNPHDPQQWIPHQGFDFSATYQTYRNYTSETIVGRVIPGQRFGPTIPPNDPFIPPTLDGFKAGTYYPHNTEAAYKLLLSGNRTRTVRHRWLHSQQRMLEDPKAAVKGVPLRCPRCGRFTDGTTHGCTNHSAVLVFTSTVVKYSRDTPIIATPHNPDYDTQSVNNLGNGRFNGYVRSPNNALHDADGYDYAGLNGAGFDRDGFNTEGYNPAGYDRDGFNRRGYNREGVDRDGNTRPLSLEVVAHGLDEGVDTINNKHIADVFSRSISTIVGKPRRVIFRAPGSGFATDMKGRIYADPQPLPSYATNAQQLLAIRAGIYHEGGHEEETPMDLWASILEIAQSQAPVTQQLDLRFANLGIQTVTIDVSRKFVKDAYNIVEDGRMERRMSDRYPGVEETLAADAQIDPRWSQQVLNADGTSRRADDVVPWALLYTALPFFNVRPSVRTKMEPATRALFEELEPIIATAVRGTPEDTWSAAMYMAARFEQEGILIPNDIQATQPGQPQPGTAPRRPRIVIHGDQIIDASSGGQGGGGGASPFDVEFTGHVTVRGQMPSDTESGDSQTIFSGGVTFEDPSQPQGNQGQSGQQQGSEQGQGQNGQQGSQGQDGQQQGSGQGSSGQDGQQQGSGQGSSGQDGQQQGSGQGDQQQGSGQGSSGQDGQQQGSGQGQGDTSGGRQYQPTGVGETAMPTEDDTNGRGKGWRRGLGQGEQEAASNNPTASGETGTNQSSDPNNTSTDAGKGAADTNAAEVIDADMEAYWEAWNDDSAAGATGAASSSQGANSQGAGGRGAAPQRQGGIPYRDADEPFTRADLAGVLASVEREAVQALDTGIRTESRIEVLGATLHQPMGNRDSQRQRFKTSEGRVEAVVVGMPRASNGVTQQWMKRRPEHKKVAARMAAVLAAIRADVDKRLRNLPQGQLDRHRVVRAVAGQQNVYTTVKTLPQTAFRASVSVDLSGSMSSHIHSGALYDSMMVLGDCFEQLDIPYEARGFGSTDAQFKSMGDPSFVPQRAAALTTTDLGGTSLAHTASLSVTALRGGEEANKLFIALSDGELSDHTETVKVLQEARRRGVVTFGIFLGKGANTQRMDELYGAGNWTHINELAEMPKAVGQRLAALFNRLAQR